MLWPHLLFLSVVVAGSPGLSVLLIPRHQELALMHLNDKNNESAMRRFEHQYFENADNAAILLPLHDIRRHHRCHRYRRPVYAR